ncbi:glycosyltransferase [Mesorhizobium yinganensis]|uniref:glycosyltransferase n=1 Tax=Mesorhizobium yinganensis TaxID=3157707 RepID=UPI0032B7FC13
MSIPWIHVLVFVGFAINAISVASVVMRLTRLQKPRSARQAAATVILPVTGASPGLEALIATLNAQTLQPRRLIISVESEVDPAYRRAAAVAPLAHFPVEIVVAGEAFHQAQKCRNQQAALARIDAMDDAIVLMDNDILPQSWWLSALVSPLIDDHSDLVTGHRWQRVARHRLGAHLVTAIDRALTLMPRPGSASTSVVWGGSVGISRAAAMSMDLAGSLEHTLSDDLSLAEHAMAANLRTLTRGALLIASPTALDLASAWRFAVRQYRIGHIYRPWLWRLAVVSVGLRLVIWATVLYQMVFLGAFVWAGAGLAALAVLKQYLVGEVARRIDMPDPFAVRIVQLLLGLLQPFVDLFHLAVLVAAASTRRVAWGHVVYDIAGPYSIEVKERLPFSAS